MNLNLTGDQFEQLWELGHHPDLDMIVDCHRVAKDDPASASLVELGNDFLHDLLFAHDIKCDSNVGQLMHNFVTYEAAKYERGTCSRVERLRDLVMANPVLQGKK
jgi:hypothetical protein